MGGGVSPGILRVEVGQGRQGHLRRRDGRYLGWGGGLLRRVPRGRFRSGRGLALTDASGGSPPRPPRLVGCLYVGIPHLLARRRRGRSPGVVHIDGLGRGSDRRVRGRLPRLLSLLTLSDVAWPLFARRLWSCLTRLFRHRLELADHLLRLFGPLIQPGRVHRYV